MGFLKYLGHISLRDSALARDASDGELHAPELLDSGDRLGINLISNKVQGTTPITIAAMKAMEDVASRVASSVVSFMRSDPHPYVAVLRC